MAKIFCYMMTNNKINKMFKVTGNISKKISLKKCRKRSWPMSEA